METMTANEDEVREADSASYPAARPPAPRHTHAATIVAGLYVLLVLGAPLIVRYGPDLEARSAAAAVTVREAGTSRCASAPEFGNSCPSGDAPLTRKVLLPIVR